MREIETSGLWTSCNIHICLLAAYFLSQHRKEKGSQDLEFLERVDDEKSKGEFCRVNEVISLCFDVLGKKVTMVVAFCFRSTEACDRTASFPRRYHQRAGENQEYVDYSTQD